VAGAAMRASIKGRPIASRYPTKIPRFFPRVFLPVAAQDVARGELSEDLRNITALTVTLRLVTEGHTFF
jgi:hypothetical protein